MKTKDINRIVKNVKNYEIWEDKFKNKNIN